MSCAKFDFPLQMMSLLWEALHGDFNFFDSPNIKPFFVGTSHDQDEAFIIFLTQTQLAATSMNELREIYTAL